ncbi:unnamed protein product [Laminaria digitata]
MGPKKKWHMHSRPKRSRDDQQQANNSDGQQPSKRARVSAMNLGNVKGHQAVVGTCDVRNDRQATAELVDLLNAFADDLYPKGGGQDQEEEEGKKGATAEAAPPAPRAATPGQEDRSSGSNKGTPPAAPAAVDDNGGSTKPASSVSASSPTATPPLSVEEMVRQEADALRSGTADSHRFKSVNTYVRGVVMVCVMDPNIDVLTLVDAVFEGIRATRKRRCRFLERVTPLQVTAFSELEAFKSAAEPVVYAALPRVAEGVPPIGDEAGGKVAPPVKANANTAAAAAAAAAAANVANAASAGKSESEAEVSPPTKEQASGEEGQTAAAAAAAGAGETITTAAADAAGGEGGGETGEVVAAKKKTCDKRWKFRVDVRRRNSGLKRLDLINAVADSVGKGHSVSMSSPEVTIAIEAVKSVVGASVLFKYSLNHEYSISRLQDAVCGALLNG